MVYGVSEGFIRVLQAFTRPKSLLKCLKVGLGLVSSASGLDNTSFRVQA